jgi:hypothetical protein
VNAEVDSFAVAMEGTPEDRIEEKLAARFVAGEEEVVKDKVVAKVKKSPRKDNKAK